MAEKRGVDRSIIHRAHIIHSQGRLHHTQTHREINRGESHSSFPHTNSIFVGKDGRECKHISRKISRFTCRQRRRAITQKRRGGEKYWSTPENGWMIHIDCCW